MTANVTPSEPHSCKEIMSTTPANDDPQSEGGKPSGRTNGDRRLRFAAEETERLLLNRLQDKNQDHKLTRRQLAVFYSEVRRYDKALDSLRELMALEPELEEKAACVLAMGGNAEKQQNYKAAVQFYREALAMEPTRVDVWYFIHNNLGFSLNKLGQFGAGEQFCRTAIDIDAARPNGHKNLGIALHGQGRLVEAAQCFITATQVHSVDARSLQLLRDLLRHHGELELEFGPELVRCEQAVQFAVLAIQRAKAGKILKILLGCNEPVFDELFSHMFLSMAGGAVETFPTSHWSDFIGRACWGKYDVAFFIPNNLRTEDDTFGKTHPWACAVRAIRQIKGNSATGIIVSGVSTDVNDHGEACREAEVDAIIELPFSIDELADAVRQCVLGKNLNS